MTPYELLGPMREARVKSLEDQIGKFQSATSAPVFPLIDQTLQRLELFEHFYLASSAANKPK